MKTETILLVGVAGVAVWYFFIRKPEPAQPAQPAQQITNITQAKRTNWQDVAIAGIQTGGNIAGKFVPGT
jgi:hypothetical protein